jgi:hypothetical protein
VAQRFPADLERIRDDLRMPSVSATGEGIGAVAEATGAWIEGAGGSFELVSTPGHPLVLGELPGPADAPRLLRYGMYDVQPAQEPSWSSPPFAAEVRDLPGVGPAVVARGSASSKGCLACFFLAVKVLRELDAMPVTVALMIEGEEELGSPHLAAGLDGGAGPGDGDRRLLAELAAGYVGPGGKTITPSRAEARVDIRLVGGDPEAAMRASYQALGRTLLPYPLAPWCAPYYVFDRILGLPWASGGVGHAAGAHGPDEYATLVGAAAFLLAYAGLPR